MPQRHTFFGRSDNSIKSLSQAESVKSKGSHRRSSHTASYCCNSPIRHFLVLIALTDSVLAAQCKIYQLPQLIPFQFFAFIFQGSVDQLNRVLESNPLLVSREVNVGEGQTARMEFNSNLLGEGRWRDI